MKRVRLLLAAASLAGLGSPGLAQVHNHGASSASSASLGELSFPNSGNTAAQVPFIRGVKLLVGSPGTELEFAL